MSELCINMANLRQSIEVQIGGNTIIVIKLIKYMGII